MSLDVSQKENFGHLMQSFYYLSLKDTQEQTAQVAVQSKIINGIDICMVDFTWNHDQFT